MPSTRGTGSSPVLASTGRKRAKAGGFTFIEILTAMAVIAILATITISAIAGVKQRANIARARSELAALADALEQFKRYYGDYPQLGEFNQAPATPTSNITGPGVNTAQAKLFNCLTGVFGPKAPSSERINGPNFLPPQLMDTPNAQTPSDPKAHVHLVGVLANTFLVPTVPSQGAAPVKVEQNVGIVDPWGRYYRYYYKSRVNPGAWAAPSYVLYSAGPRVNNSNGNDTVPLTPTTGLLLTTQTAEMADNIYANQ